MTDKSDDSEKGPTEPDKQRLVGYGLPPGPTPSEAAEPAPVPLVPLKVPTASNEATLDVAAIRAKTGLSQEEFAARYHFSKRTLQEWEQGRKRPTGAARSLLAVIRRHPKKVARALAKDTAGIGADETENDSED